MSILKDGYYHVARAGNNQLHVVTRGANHEALNNSETFASDWEGVKTNVQACLRAAHGRYGIVVDATRENLAKQITYYKLGADGSLKVVSVGDADPDAPQDAIFEEGSAADTNAQAGEEGAGNEQE